MVYGAVQLEMHCRVLEPLLLFCAKHVRGRALPVFLLFPQSTLKIGLRSFWREACGVGQALTRAA